MELDLIDKKILRALDADARQSYARIGKQNRIAKETVQYRIRSLRERGVINGCYCIVDYAKIGFMLGRFYLRLKNTPPEQEREIIASILSIRNLNVLNKIEGHYQFAIGIWARDAGEYRAVWEDMKRRFGERIGLVHFSIMTEYNEYTHDYLYGGRLRKKFGPRDDKKIELDPPDYRILDCLSDDARMPLVDIARQVKLHPLTVRTRIRSMVKNGVIVGFRPNIDIEALGYEYYKVDLWVRDYSRRETIERYVEQLPNVTYTEKTLISGDIEFDLEVRGLGEFNRIMEHIRTRFGEQIVDYTHYSRTKSYRTRYAYLPLDEAGSRNGKKAANRRRTREKRPETPEERSGNDG